MNDPEVGGGWQIERKTNHRKGRAVQLRAALRFPKAHLRVWDGRLCSPLDWTERSEGWAKVSSLDGCPAEAHSLA